MVNTITALDKQLALNRLAVVKADLNRLGKAAQTLRSPRGLRGSLTNVLRNKQNLNNLIRTKRRLDLKRKEFEDLIKLQVVNGDTIQTSGNILTRKSFLEGKQGKLIQVLAQSKRPFGGRSL